MCNLYSITTYQAAIINLFRVINRYVGNLAPMPPAAARRKRGAGIVADQQMPPRRFRADIVVSRSCASARKLCRAL
jgi:hypothetical protein